LCDTPLHPEQEWCLRCGAAARTRLAATPGWKAPIIALTVVVALSLGVLTAALVDLAGNSGSSAPATATTVTTAASAPSPTPTQSTPATSTPTATTPATTLPGAAVPGATIAPNTTGAGTGTAPGRSLPRTGARRAKRFGLGPILEKRLRERGLLPARPGK
jgi:hypothetical protein